MNKKITKILVFTGALLVVSYLVFSLYFFSAKDKEIVCEQLRIVFVDNNLSLITEQDIEQLLKQQNLHPVGKKLKDIRTEAIERALSTNEVIKSAECFITPSGVSHIRIRQRVPKFRVFANNGSSYFIDTERNKIQTSANYTAYLPIVSGNVSFEMASGELFDFITFLERNAFWNAQIEQIYIRADQKIELVPRVGDSIILLGTLENYQSKLEKLRKLYDTFNTIGWDRYRVIDLQYKGQIVGVRR
jgi:cell division protein FtsQ